MDQEKHWIVDHPGCVPRGFTVLRLSFVTRLRLWWFDHNPILGVAAVIRLFAAFSPPRLSMQLIRPFPGCWACMVSYRRPGVRCAVHGYRRNA